MSGHPIQVLGLCRWSYPSELSSFQIDYPDMDALRAYLYSPERQALRLFFFEHVLLPGIAAQTDPDFTLVIMTGEQLPADVRARLEALTALHPQIRIVSLPEGQNHRDTCREVMLAHRDPGARVAAEFRLDDDDAVATDFVAQTRDQFRKARGLFRDSGRLAIDFNRGFLLATAREKGGAAMALTPVASRYWTPALVLCLRPHTAKSLLDFHHARLWKRMPTVTQPRDWMYLRGAHGDNDSSVSVRPHNAEAIAPPAGGTAPVLRDRFAIGQEALEAAWIRHAREHAPPG